MSIRDNVARFFHDGFVVGKRRPFAIATQGGFALFLLIADLAYFFDGTPRNSTPAMVAGVLLLLLATALSVIETKLPRTVPSILIIAVLDFVALGLSRFGSLPEGAALSALAFFPATGSSSPTRCGACGPRSGSSLRPSRFPRCSAARSSSRSRS